MKKVLARSVLLLICILSVSFLGSREVRATEAAENSAAIAAKTTKSNGNPFYIMVNRYYDTVTVYALDEKGYYTLPIKAFICSTGKTPHMTPRGTYTMGKNKYRWRLMKDNSYAQYACGFNGGVMFHSVCYKAEDASTLMEEEYNSLGEKASLGCVRLQVADAKWIYDNCAPGTYVTVYSDESTPGVWGKPVKYVSELSGEYKNGWDPTDPDPANPWKGILEEHKELLGVNNLKNGENTN